MEIKLDSKLVVRLALIGLVVYLVAKGHDLRAIGDLVGAFVPIKQ